MNLKLPQALAYGQRFQNQVGFSQINIEKK